MSPHPSHSTCHGQPGQAHKHASHHSKLRNHKGLVVVPATSSACVSKGASLWEQYHNEMPAYSQTFLSSQSNSPVSYGFPHSSKSPLLSVIGVPVCATLACWQVSSMFQSKSEWSLQMDQIPANPKGDICKGPHFAQVNIADIFMLSSKLPSNKK